MTALIEEFSKLTDRFQTTVPSGVRKQIKLGKGDRIRYCTEATGRIYIESIRVREDDPALIAFLDFIETDVKAHPERLQALSSGLHDRLKALVGDAEVNLDELLSSDDE